MIRVRQAVIVAAELAPVVETLRQALGLGTPFSDPAVDHFGLRNAVFALGDTFLEVVSPVRDGTSAGRLLERRGGDCGYMVMFQVAELGAARERAAADGVREVFEIELDDIADVHLHPRDMHGAIVSMSVPRPADSWRWGGPGWRERSAPLRVAGAQIAVADPDAARARWSGVLGAAPEDAGVRFSAGAGEEGLVAITLVRAGGAPATEPLQIGGVRIVAR